MGTTTTTETTTTARKLWWGRADALQLLQQIDPNGAYTDQASAAERRRPCQLWEAIRAVGTLAEGELPEGPTTERLGQLLRALSGWAYEKACEEGEL